MERIQDLTEYHERIESWLTIAISCDPDDPQGELKWFMGHARCGNLATTFVFQDEDARHFNHDVMLECQRRLGIDTQRAA